MDRLVDLQPPAHDGNEAGEKFLLSNLCGHTNGIWRRLQTVVSLQVILRLLLCPTLNSQSSQRANYLRVWQITEIMKYRLASYSARGLFLFRASDPWGLNSNGYCLTTTRGTELDESLIANSFDNTAAGLETWYMELMETKKGCFRGTCSRSTGCFLLWVSSYLAAFDCTFTYHLKSKADLCFFSTSYPTLTVIKYVLNFFGWVIWAGLFFLVPVQNQYAPWTKRLCLLHLIFRINWFINFK